MKAFLGILFLLLVISSSAQTRIEGNVTDINTKEPIPFANVQLLDKNQGATTDLSGHFLFTTNYEANAIVVTFVGYKTDTIYLTSQNPILNIELSPMAHELEEVVYVATKYKDPNKELFKRITERKKYNDPRSLDAYESEVYNKIQIDLNNVGKQVKKRKIESINYMWDMIDSSEERSTSYMPVFIAETVSKFYVKNNPSVNKEVISASKTSGLKNESVSLLLGNTYTSFSLYDNYINLFQKDFVSPISDAGWLFYHYEATDTAYIGPYLSYKMEFKPRRAKEATFYGHFWVDADSYAITEIDMHLSEDVNVNIINDLYLNRKYVLIQGKWHKSSEHAEMDLNLIKSDKLLGFYATKTTYWKDYVIGQPKPDGFYAISENLAMEDSALDRSNEYWTVKRGEELSDKEITVYQNIDSLVQSKPFQISLNLTKMFSLGFYPLKHWEFGPYYNTYSFNSIEGNRFRFGGRTRKPFHDKFRLTSHIAYGTEDDRMKGGITGEYFFSKIPRVLLTVSYLNDYRQLSDSPDAFSPDNIMASLSRRVAPQFTLMEQRMISFQKEWKPGISNTIMVNMNDYRPVGELIYLNPRNEFINNISITSFHLAGRLAFKEQFVLGDFDRVSLGTQAPIFTYGVSGSKQGVLNSDYDFVRAFVQMDDRYYLGTFGYLDLILDASKIWGEVPYPILLQHPGNSSYYFDKLGFNLMNPGEFVSDQFFSVKTEYHMDGFLLNKIPLINKLEWREIVYARGVVGSIENDHESVVLFPANMSSLQNKPYLEVGLGVENIFKFFRVDVIQRLTHLDQPGISKIGLFGGLDFNF